MILVALGVGLLRPCSHLTFCKKLCCKWNCFICKCFNPSLGFGWFEASPKFQPQKYLPNLHPKPFELTFGATQVRSFSCNHLCCSFPCSAAQRCWRNCEGPMQSRSSIESTVADTAQGISTHSVKFAKKGCWMLLAYMLEIGKLLS